MGEARRILGGRLRCGRHPAAPARAGRTDLRTPRGGPRGHAPGQPTRRGLRSACWPPPRPTCTRASRSTSRQSASAAGGASAYARPSAPRTAWRASTTSTRSSRASLALCGGVRLAPRRRRAAVPREPRGPRGATRRTLELRPALAPRARGPRPAGSVRGDHAAERRRRGQARAAHLRASASHTSASPRPRALRRRPPGPRHRGGPAGRAARARRRRSRRISPRCRTPSIASNGSWPRHEPPRHPSSSSASASASTRAAWPARSASHSTARPTLRTSSSSTPPATQWCSRKAS